MKQGTEQNKCWEQQDICSREKGSPMIKKGPRQGQGGWSRAVTPAVNNTGFCMKNSRESLQTVEQGASYLTSKVSSEK